MSSLEKVCIWKIADINLSEPTDSENEEDDAHCSWNLGKQIVCVKQGTGKRAGLTAGIYRYWNNIPSI